MWAYFRQASNYYGTIEPTSIQNSCDTPWNPTHRKLNFNLRTEWPTEAYVGSANAQHIEDIGVSVGSVYECPVWLAAQGSGNTYVSSTCFTGSHTHYYADGSQVGSHPYSELTYLDSPIMWQWTV